MWPGCELTSDPLVCGSEPNGTTVPLVRTFRVCLSEPVIIPANKTAVVSVCVELDDDVNPVPLLLKENGSVCKETGLIIGRALFQPSHDGMACLKIHNVGGFTERIEEGALLGDAGRPM